MLGLPDAIEACLFDLDGVLTDTAAVHYAAWKAIFDPILIRHGQAPMNREDYDTCLDGRTRLDGVRAVLQMRGIALPLGDPDTDDLRTQRGIAASKNAELRRLISRDGVQVFPGSLRYVQTARDAGLRRVVVSSSANAETVLHVTGLAPLIEECIDGQAIVRRNLAGKPAPDAFLAGAAAVAIPPDRAAVFEDALAGVQAGQSGGFGYVIGVNRHGARHAQDLTDRGADLVVADLGQLLAAAEPVGGLDSGTERPR